MCWGAIEYYLHNAGKLEPGWIKTDPFVGFIQGYYLEYIVIVTFGLMK